MLVTFICWLSLNILVIASVDSDTTPLARSEPEHCSSMLDSCQAMRRESALIRSEGYSAINRADSIREQAYRVKDEAIELKEEALEVREGAASARSALESRLVETLVDIFTYSIIFI